MTYPPDRHPLDRYALEHGTALALPLLHTGPETRP
jgi:hypothetical protein